MTVTPTSLRIVVKVGGAGLEQPAGRMALAAAVRAARDDGHQVTLVHGGGNQIRAWGKPLGIENRYHQGLRITDAATADLVTAVLAGLVNKELVAALSDAGVPAAGLCGADGDTFAVTKHTPNGVDLGFVGTICDVQPALLASLLEADIVPVLSTVGPLARGAAGSRAKLYNVNADMAAAPIACALAADALLFLTEVAAVRDEHGAAVARLDAATAARLAAAGALQGGMQPKVHAALDARAMLRTAHIVIAPGDGPDAIRRALRPGVGTAIAGEPIRTSLPHSAHTES